jgi:Zn-dependent peptidase ImmA (M78 family)
MAKKPTFDLKIFFKPLRSVRGWYVPGRDNQDRIEIATSLTEAERITTLYHEFTHFLLQRYADCTPIFPASKFQKKIIVKKNSKKYATILTDKEEEALCTAVEDAATKAFFKNLYKYRKK